MERSINLLIANENEEDANLISEKLTKENNLATIDKTSSGLKAIELVKSKNYDLVILDLVLAEVDGFEVIEEIKNLNKNTKIIVLSALSSDTFIKKAMSLGVDYYMLKPANLDVLSKRVKDLVEGEQISSAISKNTDKEIEEKITNIFITVGIPAHIKGYQFLREAIKLAMENPDIINSITKKLYPSIAERFDTSASKVERAIRHAIEVAWNRGKIENINNIFGLTVYSNNEKPTNGEFIALVADKMLLDV
mgnify:CR=1 FL=1